VGDLVGKKAGPIYALIEEIYGEKVTEIEQTLRVVAVPEPVAPGLGVEPMSAAVEVRRTYRLATGELAEIAFNLHPADRFSYSLTLRRRR
jgi:DNA-binding GntR family transcriptional regulator